LAMPVPRGREGANGFKGRGAANYQVVATDINNNLVLRTARGYLVVNPDDLDAIKGARNKGSTG